QNGKITLFLPSTSCTPSNGALHPEYRMISHHHVNGRTFHSPSEIQDSSVIALIMQGRKKEKCCADGNMRHNRSRAVVLPWIYTPQLSQVSRVVLYRQQWDII